MAHQLWDIITKARWKAFSNIFARSTTAFTFTSQKLILFSYVSSDGTISADDLENYEARVRDALNVHLENGNLTMYGPPPPSSGSIAQFIMNILDGKFPHHFFSTHMLSRLMLLYFLSMTKQSFTLYMITLQPSILLLKWHFSPACRRFLAPGYSNVEAVPLRYWLKLNEAEWRIYASVN